MELGLSLGEAPKALCFLEKLTSSKDPSFLSRFSPNTCNHEDGNGPTSSSPPSLHLHLLPSNPPPPSPPPRLSIPWLSPTLGGGEDISSDRVVTARGLDVNSAPADVDDADDLSSPNSEISSFHMDFRVGSYKRGEHEGSDDDENGSNRKKLRLSKEQSAFLEDSFKEHSTLNPKQKLALAKQLNLRPRQVEVWFQNRRARTKLKQTEVDCEYLKRCCETLTEENRRLQKEVQELRALKTTQPYYMQLPATTLTMCPSCEKVVTKSSAAAAGTPIPVALSLAKPGSLPFANGQAHPQQAQAQAHHIAS